MPEFGQEQLVGITVSEPALGASDGEETAPGVLVLTPSVEQERDGSCCCGVHPPKSMRSSS